ncbi:hypothetical protein ABL78_4624 [Leptomonas seymouri]|uniref:Uncharacterized protein n=1 Tax=Leptomonas seymouri TaxID=5684 RepID=A0A0N0P5D1_LEPSE|nr:hypothetical protein ABL78_4624 [Leptomonas seymouri]|eukprot:KPI86319.1 hypothetical protein ABL78_4624 [Leptomonas seymouri]
MPSIVSRYTFADFLQRLERSPVAHVSPLYHEHRLLFVNRPDMLSKVVLSISWERGLALLDAAYYTQPVAAETYRALLGRMLRHNRHVETRGAGQLVSWQAAMKVMNEAVLTHGTSLPTRVTVSTLRLLAPHRQWRTAIDLLKLCQANGQLTKPMLLDAAHACATSAAWPEALKLLMHLHKQEPTLLHDAIQGMRPPGSNALTSAASAHALLPATPVQQHILEVLNSVVGSVPHEVALRNPLCSSYLTHLLASTTLTPELKVRRATLSMAQLPWTAALQLLTDVSEPTLLTDKDWERVQDTVLVAEKGSSSPAKSSGRSKKRKRKEPVERVKSGALTREGAEGADATLRDLTGNASTLGRSGEEASSGETTSASAAAAAITFAATAIFSRLQLLRTSPLTCAAMIAVMVDKLPTPEMAVSFIRCCAAQLAQSSTSSSPPSLSSCNASTAAAGPTVALPEASAAGSVAATRHPVVVHALLRNCARHDTGWSTAANVLLEHSGAQVATPAELLSTLVHQLRQAKQVSLVVRLLHEHIIPSGSVLTARAWEDVLECALAHNRALRLRSVEGDAPEDDGNEHLCYRSIGTPRQLHLGPTLSASRLSGVHWVSALSWVLDRQAAPREVRIVKPGTGPSLGATPRHPIAHVHVEQPLTPKMLSLLINICVQGGSPPGALYAMGYARRVDKTELPHTPQIRALLYCMQYSRPFEAEAIVAQLAKQEGEEAARPLQHLLKIMGESKQGDAPS